MPVTLQQIADSVGVSKQAVSYALNGKLGQVSPTTRRRVRDAAKAMGYQPNWRARSFALRKSQVIGLVYGQPTEYVERSRTVAALVEQLAERDHELLLIPARGPVETWGHKLHDGRVDACIVTFPMPADVDRFITQHDIPAVLANIRSDLPVPQVRFDDHAGVRLAVDHLLGLGHRRIAFFSTPKRDGQHYSFEDRRDGYLDAMQAAGLSDAARVAVADYPDFVNAFLAANPADRPTAIVGYNDHDATRLLKHLWRAGVRVPDQLSVTGFNNDASSEHVIPPLTTVDLPVKDLARECIACLLDRTSPDDHPNIVLEEKLLVRDSTAPPAA